MMRRFVLTLIATLALATSAAAQTIPPAPATVAEAVRQANDFAYGFDKNTVDYWEHLPYASDPVYFFKRMLGWQAGEADRAVYGLYAVPPSSWRSIVVAPPPPVVTPAPLPSLDLSSVAAQLEVLNAKLDELARASGDAHASLNQNISDARAENRSFFESVGRHWKSLAAIAGPAVSWWVAKRTGQP